MPTVHARTLKRAAHIVGGYAQLSTQLGVPIDDAASWAEGTKPVPDEIFLRAVDIVTAHEVAEISGRYPNLQNPASKI